MRIFRMMRAVRAARAVAKLSANMDIFDAAAAGNLAMIAKKVSSAKKDDEEEELDPGTVQRLICLRCVYAVDATPYALTLASMACRGDGVVG